MTSPGAVSDLKAKFEKGSTPPKPPTTTTTSAAATKVVTPPKPPAAPLAKPATTTTTTTTAAAKPIAPKPAAVVAKPVTTTTTPPPTTTTTPPPATTTTTIPKPTTTVAATTTAVSKPVVKQVVVAKPAAAVVAAVAPVTTPTSTTPSREPTPEPTPTTLPLSIEIPEEDGASPEVILAPSTPSTPRFFSAPPSVEEQDYMYLQFLSLLVPFFLLRFVFEFTRRLVLVPIRFSIRWTPGGRKLLAFLYVKLGPLGMKVFKFVLERLPGTEYLKQVGTATLERFLATMSTVLSTATPHMLELAESIKRLEFRQAFMQTLSVLKAWAPMLLLVIPFLTNAFTVSKDGAVWFSQFSKTAIYRPFGTFLKSAVKSLGQALTENPEVFAETISGLLGPIVISFVAIVFVVYLLFLIGLVDYGTLSSLWIAWIFRWLGLVTEPVLAAVPVVDLVAAVPVGDVMMDAVGETDAGAGGGGGWGW